MGEYFAAFCDEKKEQLHPSAYSNNKFPGICNPTNIFGQLLVFVMCTRWKAREVTIVDDTSHFFYECDYENITADIYEEYKKIYDVQDITSEYKGFKGLKCEENMIVPLNNYYLVKLIDETQKAGILFFTDDRVTFIKKALLVCCPGDDSLDLRPGDCVYINAVGINEIPGETNQFLLKKDYILAEYIDK